MSVFTPITLEQAKNWLNPYALGTVLSCEGISAGVQNSNFFLDTTQGQYVLTIFEQFPREELPFYVGLMVHLTRQGIPCPAPFADRDGEYLNELCGKPAIVVSRLPGRSLETPDIHHCAALGDMLAALHLAALSCPVKQKHSRDAAWCRAIAVQIEAFLSDDELALLRSELRHQARHRPYDLPRGIIHADLFRDNVLFDGGCLSGLLDFYFAGVDDWLFDIAVTVNDWCGDAHGMLDVDKTCALLNAYHARRALTAGERAAWPTMLRAAALRFWLSRLADFHRPRAGDLVSRRDPEQFRTILQARIVMGERQPWLAALRSGV